MELELPDTNLYINGELIDFGAGELALLREPLDITPKTEDRWHTVTTMDRLDLLAYKEYNRYVEDASKLWWVIADANNIPDPTDLSDYVGTKILLPNILRVLLMLNAA